MIKPKHLEKIFHPYDEKGLRGKIVCECGCGAFRLRCFGTLCRENRLSVRKCGDRYGQAVRAVCADCRAEHLLYDFALHGFDGRIGGEGIAASREMLADFVTETDRLFAIKMLLEYDDEEQFLEEIVNDEALQREFHFTMADRANIWSWIVMELKGVQSGTVYKDFVNEELA